MVSARGWPVLVVSLVLGASLVLFLVASQSAGRLGRSRCSLDNFECNDGTASFYLAQLPDHTECWQMCLTGDDASHAAHAHGVQEGLCCSVGYSIYAYGPAKFYSEPMEKKVDIWSYA